MFLHSVETYLPDFTVPQLRIPQHEITVEQSCNNVELFNLQLNFISCEIMYLIESSLINSHDEIIVSFFS